MALPTHLLLVALVASLCPHYQGYDSSMKNIKKVVLIDRPKSYFIVIVSQLEQKALHGPCFVVTELSKLLTTRVTA